MNYLSLHMSESLLGLLRVCVIVNLFDSSLLLLVIVLMHFCLDALQEKRAG
jgi:hypothetical protein